jgi:hypothetical protein
VQHSFLHTCSVNVGCAWKENSKSCTLREAGTLKVEEWTWGQGKVLGWGGTYKVSSMEDKGTQPHCASFLWLAVTPRNAARLKALCVCLSTWAVVQGKKQWHRAFVSGSDLAFAAVCCRILVAESVTGAAMGVGMSRLISNTLSSCTLTQLSRSVLDKSPAFTMQTTWCCWS